MLKLIINYSELCLVSLHICIICLFWSHEVIVLDINNYGRLWDTYAGVWNNQNKTNKEILRKFEELNKRYFTNDSNY